MSRFDQDRQYQMEVLHHGLNRFITSENYLVVGGRDAQQNEQLVKRYLKKVCLGFK